MDTLVPIERQPLGPTQNMSEESWLDRRMRLVTSDLGRKEREMKRSHFGTDFSVASLEKEGELVQVSARVEKIVQKPDVEVLLSFPVQGASGTLQMFANCEVHDYDRRNKGEVLFHGESVPVSDLGRFILEDTKVIATVYWKSSRVVTTGKRWKVAKLWKPDPNGHVDVFSVTSWTHVNPEQTSKINRCRSDNSRMPSVPLERISRASSEPPKLLSADTNAAKKDSTNQNMLTEKKEGDSSEDQYVRTRSFSWGTLMKKRIGCNVKNFSKKLPNAPQSVPTGQTAYSEDAASTSLPSSTSLDDASSSKDSSSPVLDAGNHNSINSTQTLPLCLFGIPGVISQVKQGSGGTEYAVTFTRMGETYEALMMKKYLSELMVDCVTETWLNVHEMMIPGLEVVIDVKNILFNEERKWLVFGLYLGKLQRSEVSHVTKNDTSRKLKMKLKEEVWEKEMATVKDSEAEEVEDSTNNAIEVSNVDIPFFSTSELQSEIDGQVKVNSQSTTPIENKTRLQLSTAYHPNLDESQLYFGATLMKEPESDVSFSDCEGDEDKTCDHKFDYSGAISEIDSTTFSFIGPFGEKWINAKLDVAKTNFYVDGVRIQESSDKSSFLKKAKGAMGNLVISKCLKCSDFDLSDNNDLLINEACLAWFGIDNAPWLQGDLGKVSEFSSINEGRESLAVIRLANSSSKVWYKLAQHTGPNLSINSEVLVWAFRECTEAYYIGAAVVVVPESRNLRLNGMEDENQLVLSPLNDCNMSVYQNGSNEMEEAYLKSRMMDDTNKSIDLKGVSTNDVRIEDVNFKSNVSNQKKMANPSEGSLSDVISPLDLECSANTSELFSFKPYKEIATLKLLDASNDLKKESSAIRAQLRSLPSTTDSEYSEVDYRGTLAQIEAFKKIESVEKRVAFQSPLIEVDVSSHLHGGFELELNTSDNSSALQDRNNLQCHEDSADAQQKFDNRIYDAEVEVEESEDEVFSQVLDISQNEINTEEKNESQEVKNEEIENLENFDDGYKYEMNKLLIRDDKLANSLGSHDDFFKYAKLELSFGALVRDNSMMNLPNPIIDTQFEMILCVNDLDSPQLIYSQANTFDECCESGDWTRMDPVERVGRFTVYGKDSPEKRSTKLLKNYDNTDEDLPRPANELSLPTVEHQTISSLTLLPPIPEEKETCSDAVSSDGSFSGTDGCEYSMSWTYSKSQSGTLPTNVDTRTTSPTTVGARTTSPTNKDAKTPPPNKVGARMPPTKAGSRTPPTKAGSRTPSPTKARARTPPPTNLIRYTSTPHLNEEENLKRKFSADSSSSLIHSFNACDTDSGLGESNNKTALTETSIFSSDDQVKTTKIKSGENKIDIETDFTKKPCFWYAPTPLGTTASNENSEVLIKENLLEFLSFTDFPEDHRTELVEKFMKSGKMIL